MKVAIIVSYNEARSFHPQRGSAYVNAYLKRLGYETEIHTAVDTQQGQFTFLTEANGYAFAVHYGLSFNPTATNDSVADLLDGTLGVTCFNLSVITSTIRLNMADLLGISDTNVGIQGHHTCTWRGIDTYVETDPTTERSPPNKTVTPIITLKNNPTHLVAWKTDGTVKPIYSSCSQFSSIQGLVAFPMLLQEAIDAGDISSPAKIAATSLNIDHMPGKETTIEDCQAVHDLGVPIVWGMQAGTQNASPVWPAITADVKAFVAANTHDKGGNIYPCIHNHEWVWDLAGGTIIPITTKAEMDTEYRADLAKVRADGITIATNSDGFIHLPSNRISDEALQLMSPQVSKLSSPNNDTIQAGYGITHVRTSFGSPAEDEVGGVEFAGGLQMFRGIRLIGTATRFLDGAPHTNITPDETQDSTETTIFSQSFYDFVLASMMLGKQNHGHDTNLWTNHDGGNAPLLKLWKLYIAVSAQLKDLHSFKHPANII